MPTVAQTLYTISGQELTHASMLHDLVARPISDYKAKHGDPPADMLTLYNYRQADRQGGTCKKVSRDV